MLALLKTFFTVELVLSIGTPDWDRLFDDHSVTAPIREHHDDDLLDLHSAFPPIPAFEHAIKPSDANSYSNMDKLQNDNKKRKRTRELRQDPKNRRRRLKYAEEKVINFAQNGGNTLLRQQAQQASQFQDQKRLKSAQRKRERRKRQKEFLHLPGNEEKLREHKERISKYNKSYTTKLAKEIREGTISEQRKKSFENRRQIKNVFRSTKYRKSKITSKHVR